MPLLVYLNNILPTLEKIVKTYSAYYVPAIACVYLYINSFNNTDSIRYALSTFTDEETVAQRDEISCSRS